MTVHLLKSKPGKCVACGAVYSETEHPGSFFDSPRSWSLHHERCKPGSVAVGAIEAPEIIANDDPRNLYPGPGKPEGRWPDGGAPL